MSELIDATRVRDRLDQHISRHRNESQSSIGRSVGVSSSAISQFLSGNYKGRVNELAAMLNRYLDQYDRRTREVFRADFIQSKNVQRIWDAFELAEIEGDMAVVTGDSGTGKTKAAQEYAKRYGALLIEVDPGYTKTALLSDICARMNLASNGRSHALLNRIVANAPKRLLIIDEAENLSYQVLEVVRRVHDKAGIPVALIGMPRLSGNLRGEAGLYKQLYTRVGIYIEVAGIQDEDYEAFYTQAPVAVDVDAKAEIRRRCHGNIRMLDKLMRKAVRIAMKAGENAINPQIVEAAAGYLLR